MMFYPGLGWNYEFWGGRQQKCSSQCSGDWIKGIYYLSIIDIDFGSVVELMFVRLFTTLLRNLPSLYFTL